MKKILVIVLAVILPFCFLACNTTVDTVIKLEKYLTTYETNLYTAVDSNFNIFISTITQESPFLTDGKVGSLKETTSIQLKPNTSKYLQYLYDYTIVGEKGEITGTLSKTKLGISFKDDIENLDQIGNISSLSITYNDTTENYILTNVLNGAINYKEALTASYNHFKDSIDLDNFDREIYIKLINNEQNNSNYYYYVSYIKTSDDYYSCLIDLNGKYISERIVTIDKN